MTDSISLPQDAAPLSRRVIHNFCGFANEVPVGEEDPLCWNCGVALFRDTAKAAAAVDPLGDAATPVEKVAPRGRLSRRRKRRQGKAGTQGTEVAGESPVQGGLVAPLFDEERALRVAPVAPITPIRSEPVALSAMSEMSQTSTGTGAGALLRMFADEADEATVLRVATPPVVESWVLELETGHVATLATDEVVVGRRPAATGDATPVSLPDPERTLSRTHARLCRDSVSDTWTVEDMGSSNGVATFNGDTEAWTYATPGHPVEATEFMLFGTARARLYRATALETPRAMAMAPETATDSVGDVSPAVVSR